ncbi:PHP domain-containing protein, partial [Accumulibacter sp.]|uniref:PHP domain-containing protein n=1 Tax=Accumulibacter sp. TaxID=2053492 RepID=UPI0025C2B569
MPETPFVHLRLHSEYSVTDGIVRLGDALARAASDGMPALALTDLANVFGLVKFYSSARGKGIKPLLGSDVFIANEADPDRPYRLLLLVRSGQGYRQLCELLSRAYLAPRVRGRAEVSRRMLHEVGVDGLIALSGAAAGDIGEALLQGKVDQATLCARRWEQLFPGGFYLEVQRYGQPQQEFLLTATADLAAELELPLVATHPIQFLERDDFKAHEARVCIAEGYMLGDVRRPKLYTEEQYFKSTAEMVALFADLPEALENAVEIAKRDSEAKHYAAFANALLRRITAEKAEILVGMPDGVDAPEWLFERWKRAYGPEQASAIARIHQQEPPVDLTVFESLSPEIAGRMLSTGSFRLGTEAAISALPGYAEGAFQVQDAAAALPARLVGAKPGMRIADLCAAPWSLADLAANRPASYNRTLSQPVREASAYNAALAFSHQWNPNRWFSTLAGARLEGNRFGDTPPENVALEQALGVRTGVAPSHLHVSPRVGFSYTYSRSRENGNGQFNNGSGSWYRNTMGIIRGGIGEFRDLYR